MPVTDWEDNSFFERNLTPIKTKPKPIPTPAGNKKVRTRESKRKPVKVQPEKKVLRTAEPITKTTRDTRDQYEAVQKFCDSIKPGSRTIYVGIDPGATGGIALLHPTDNRLTTVIDIPTVLVTLQAKRKGKEQRRTCYDNAALWQIFKLLLRHGGRLLVCLERGLPRPTDTPLTAYSVGAGYHMWPLFLHSHNISMADVQPSAWKAKLGLSGSDKEMSRFMAQKLFPGAPLFSKKHHNRAESLLLAEYFKRERGGSTQ